jgi:hypothetical protein
MMELPRIISVDDHVVEPAMLWQDRLSRADREHGPKIERCFGHLDWDTGGTMNLVEDPAGTESARWMPFMMERLDGIWERSDSYDKNMRTTIPQRPSDYVPGRIHGCIFDDVQGPLNRSAVGMGQIMFETDYPHADSTSPDSRVTAEKLAGAAELSDHEIWQFVRGNAIESYGLSRFGITE